ncbi:TonB-dependent receptor domain-containing protein, partial [Alcanivorax sp. HI0083]
NENFTDGDRDSIFNTRSRAANWQNVFALGDHQLVVGADYLQDLVDSTTLYSEEERENTAGFAQLLLNFGAFDVQASGRYDDNEAYGSETTGGLALGYKLDAHHRIRASYGTAFRAPTFNDLYFPGFGNDQLDPESSKST